MQYWFGHLLEEANRPYTAQEVTAYNNYLLRNGQSDPNLMLPPIHTEEPQHSPALSLDGDEDHDPRTRSEVELDHQRHIAIDNLADAIDRPSSTLERLLQTISHTWYFGSR